MNTISPDSTVGEIVRAIPARLRILAQFKVLTDSYTPPDWACNTFRALYDGLAQLENNMHQHVHKENNVLFPRALAMR